MVSLSAQSTHSTTQSPTDEVLVGPDSEVAPSVSVVMPTMNEQQGIEECIDRVKRAAADSGYLTEVIISDDSEDRTPEIAREQGAIVVEPDRPGYGYAYQYAFERCRGDYIVIGDADTTYDFAQFPTLLEPVVTGDADLTLGTRLNGEIEPGAMPALHQYVGNPLLTAFLNVFYNADVTDAHSGFRAFDAGLIDDIDLETTGMEFASEMIMLAGAQDFTIEEIPITYHEREGEATLDSFRDGWRHIRFMLLNAPGYLFSIPGVAMGGLGLLVLTVAFGDFTIGPTSPGIRAAIAGALLTLVGFQVALLGIFATVVGDPIRRPRDAATRIVIERLNLEQMSTLGVFIFTGGGAYIAWLTFQWRQKGLGQLPTVVGDVVALTAIVLGIQIVFNAFFMSAIGTRE